MSDDDYDPDLDPYLFDDRDNEYCDHIEAELDWEGHFECSCGHRWYATSAEMDAYWASYDRAHRPPTWHERMDAVFAELKSIARRLWPQSKIRREMDDEIPF